MTVYTFEETCDYLKIRRNALYKLINEGELKGFRIGKLRRFSNRELERFVEKMEALENTKEMG